MGLIASGDRERLRQSLVVMPRSVRLVFFTQTLGCETCLQARQILDELPILSEKITIEEANVVLDRDSAAAYGVDRAPAVVLLDVGSSRVDLQACKLEYSIVSPK